MCLRNTGRSQMPKSAYWLCIAAVGMQCGLNCSSCIAPGTLHTDMHASTSLRRSYRGVCFRSDNVTYMFGIASSERYQATIDWMELLQALNWRGCQFFTPLPLISALVRVDLVGHKTPCTCGFPRIIVRPTEANTADIMVKVLCARSSRVSTVVTLKRKP